MSIWCPEWNDRLRRAFIVSMLFLWKEPSYASSRPASEAVNIVTPWLLQTRVCLGWKRCLHGSTVLKSPSRLRSLLSSSPRFCQAAMQRCKKRHGLRRLPWYSCGLLFCLRTYSHGCLFICAALASFPIVNHRSLWFLLQPSTGVQPELPVIIRLPNAAAKV